MDVYAIAKDIVVPLAAPTIAVATLVVYAVQERRRIYVQRDIDMEKSIGAVYRDAQLVRESYQMLFLKLLRHETIEPERYATIEQAAERMFHSLYEQPVLYAQYFSKRMPEINRDKLPLLLAELEIRLKTIRQSKAADPFVMFGLYILLYAGAETAAETHENRQILHRISASEPPLFAAFWKP